MIDFRYKVKKNDSNFNISGEKMTNFAFLCTVILFLYISYHQFQLIK